VTHDFEPTISVVDRGPRKIVGSSIAEPTILAEQGVELQGKFTLRVAS